ncbi:PAS domain-containing protein, partial [bacterium]|nr:PAS domain-containing protein [bacterium]
MKILDYLKPSKVDNNFNLLPDGVFTLEQDGKIIDVNDKILKMFNASRFDFLGRYFSDCVENGTSVLNEVIKSGDYICAKAKVKDTEPPMVLEINTIRNDEVQRVYVCARDVTGRQREHKSISEKYTIAQKI